eukprot:Awhi_evm1s6263
MDLPGPLAECTIFIIRELGGLSHVQADILERIVQKDLGGRIWNSNSLKSPSHVIISETL